MYPKSRYWVHKLKYMYPILRFRVHKLEYMYPIWQFRVHYKPKSVTEILPEAISAWFINKETNEMLI